MSEQRDTIKEQLDDMGEMLTKLKTEVLAARVAELEAELVKCEHDTVKKCAALLEALEYANWFNARDPLIEEPAYQYRNAVLDRFGVPRP